MKKRTLQSAVLAVLLCGVAGYAGATIPYTEDNVIVKPTYSTDGGTRTDTEVTNLDTDKVLGDENTVIGLHNQVGEKISEDTTHYTDQNTVIGYRNFLAPPNDADGSSVIGSQNKVGSSESVVIGLQNKVAHDGSSVQNPGTGGYRYNIALGYQNSISEASYGIALGQQSEVTQNYGVAIGYLARANAKSSMAIGFRAYTDATADAMTYDSETKTWISAVSFGSIASQNDNKNIYLARLRNIAAGVKDTDAVNVKQMNTAISTAIDGITIPDCIVTHDDSNYWLDVAWNSSTTTTTRGKESVAYGYGANAQTNYSVAIGSSAKTVRSENGVTATTGQNVAIGRSAKTLADYSIAIGASSQATQTQGIAIGYQSKGSGKYSTAIGQNAAANSAGAIAIGLNVNQNTTAGDYAVAIGMNAKSAGDDAVAIGDGAKASAQDSVAIGHNSTANEANTVSVGRAQAGSLSAINRKIVYVAAGMADTDAVNFSQIKTVASTTQNGTYIQSSLMNVIIEDEQTTALNPNGTVGANIAALDAKAVAAYAHDTDTTGKVNEINLSGAARSAAATSKKGNTNELIANDGTVLATFTVGSIADGNYGFISGDTVYEYVKPVAKSGTSLKTISAANSTGVNLGLLDAAIEEAKVSSAYTGSDTITIDEDKTLHVTNMAMSTMWTDVPGASATGNYAFAIGGGAKASGIGAVALGVWAEALSNPDATEDPKSVGATVAIGLKAKAYGNGAAVIGANAKATGEEGIAIGSLTVSTGYEATAVGSGANAKEGSTTAIGAKTEASGVGASAFGFLSKATEVAALASGFGSEASGAAAAAYGAYSQAAGTGAVAFGYQSHATKDGASAYGYNSAATGTKSTAIGFQAVADTDIATEDGKKVTTVSFGHQNGDSYWYVDQSGNHVSATYNDVLLARLTNIADGKSNTDAATYGQLVNAQEQGNGTYTAYEFGTDGVATILNNAGGTAFKLKMAASGSVAATDAGYVTGSTVYKYVTPADAQGVAKDGTYVKQDMTTGQNLYALDTQVNKNTDAIAAIQGNISSIETNVGTVSGKVNDLDSRIGTLNNTTYNVISYGNTVSQNLAALDGAITGAVMPDISHLKDITRSDGATAEGTDSLALGNDSHADATNSISFGTGSKVTGEGSIAIGSGSTVTGTNSIAVGTDHTVCGANSGAFGDPNNVHGHDSYAFGNDITIGNHERDGEVGNNTFVLGNKVTTTASNAVILGNESTAEEDHVVSVGSEGGERKIIHVKAGENDTDAVNVSQLKQSVSAISGDINKVGAGAAALAALHPEGYDPADKWSFAVGYGHYKNANAGALGAFYKPNFDTTLSFGGTIGNGDAMLNAGVSFKLGSRGKTLMTNASNADLVREVNQLRAQNARSEEKNVRYEEKIDAQDKRIKALEAQMQKLLEAVGKA